MTDQRGGTKKGPSVKEQKDMGEEPPSQKGTASGRGNSRASIQGKNAALRRKIEGSGKNNGKRERRKRQRGKAPNDLSGSEKNSLAKRKDHRGRPTI